MKKILSYCKSFIKSIFGGVIFLSVKLLSIVNKKSQISKEYIKLNINPDDDKKTPRPLPKPEPKIPQPPIPRRSNENKES